MHHQSPVAVLGAGSFGTALAIALTRAHQKVTLWGHNADHLAALAEARENRRYLPDIHLPEGLSVDSSLDRIASRHRHFLLVIPSHAFRGTVERLKRACERADNPPDIIGWGTKGFEPHTGALLSTVIEDAFAGEAQLAVVTGPSFARELAHGLPTTLTVASNEASTARQVASWLQNPTLKAYTNTDLAGTQTGGAVKNVMAIATGIGDGLGLGANARAGLITRGLAELTRLGQRLGGETETFMGLSGLGDLILTCTDDQSRNRRVGLGLGQGKSLEQIMAEIGQEAEGVITTKTVHHLAVRLNIDMPITQAVFKVLYEQLSPVDGVKQLLARALKPEF